jgi:hypothetical protein
MVVLSFEVQVCMGMVGLGLVKKFCDQCGLFNFVG